MLLLTVATKRAPPADDDSDLGLKTLNPLVPTVFDIVHTWFDQARCQMRNLGMRVHFIHQS